MYKILRMRKSEDLSNEAFYKSLTNVWEDHIVTRAGAEGQHEICAVRYAPRRASLDLFESKRANIMLYGVFIMDDCDEFLPEWRDLLMEIEDSEVLPTKLSREGLEQKQILKKCLEIFAGIAEKKTAELNEQVGNMVESKRENITLYGVFIMDDSDECLSEWLILFLGVGDEDVPSLASLCSRRRWRCSPGVQ